MVRWWLQVEVHWSGESKVIEIRFMTELETKFTAVEPHEVAWYFFSYTQDEEISFDCKNKVCQALYEFCPLLLWTEFVESSLLMNLRHPV